MLAVVLLLSGVLLLIAAVPDALVYRVSKSAGHARSGARFSLAACGLALTIGVATTLFVNSAS